MYRDHGGHPIQPDSTAIGKIARCAALLFQHFDWRDTTHHIDKVLGLTRDMKANVIALQQAADNLAAPRQHIKHIRRGEISVVEKGDIQVRSQRPQKGRHHPQVVVVQPNYRALCSFRCGALGKQAIDLEEHGPIFLTEHRSLPEGVQRWPERLLGKSFVKDIHVVLA